MNGFVEYNNETYYILGSFLDNSKLLSRYVDVFWVGNKNLKESNITFELPLFPFSKGEYVSCTHVGIIYKITNIDNYSFNAFGKNLINNLIIGISYTRSLSMIKIDNNIGKEYETLSNKLRAINRILNE